MRRFALAAVVAVVALAQVAIPTSSAPIVAEHYEVEGSETYRAIALKLGLNENALACANVDCGSDALASESQLTSSPGPGRIIHLAGTVPTTTTTVPATTTTTTPPPSQGNTYLPFGPKQLPYTEFGKPPFTGAYINTSSLTNLTQRVQAARQTNTKLIIKLAPAHDSMISPTTGCFDINLWKDSVAKLFPFDLTPYVADGTVLGAELVNEPHAMDWCTTNSTTQISKADLEEMGRYVKAVWPTLPVGAGRSDYMLANAPWTYIDFGHSQYHMRKGDVTTWVNTTVAESKAAGLQLLISLDWLVGQLDDTAMTAEQLRVNGIALARDPYSCMMTGYLYDATYQAQPGIMDAMRAIAEVANSHPAPPCFVGSSVT